MALINYWESMPTPRSLTSLEPKQKHFVGETRRSTMIHARGIMFRKEKSGLVLGQFRY
jgi:hypothetical protein